MKKLAMVLGAFAFLGSFSAVAQKEANTKVWEEAQARKIEPEIRTFVTPQICDMQMLSKSRETFGPYYFEIKSVEQTFNFELENFQNRALYRALQESDADAIIEPLFNSYVYDKDQKTLIVELSGFPIKYTNFRPATSAEVNMIGVIYPDIRTSVSLSSDSNTSNSSSSQAKTK